MSAPDLTARERQQLAEAARMIEASEKIIVAVYDRDHTVFNDSRIAGALGCVREARRNIETAVGVAAEGR